MLARDRSAILLGILALALFIVRWPLDNLVCDPARWHSKTQLNRNVLHPTLMPWRQPSADTGGQSIFEEISSGGSGTPAIFAMLGGQRDMVANIMWTYSDVLFHKGKPYDMVKSLWATVRLNPKFTEAWSVLGWHQAWNLNAYTDDIVLKAKYLNLGEAAYLQAVEQNPEKPRHYFDLAWLYITRKGDYEAALPWLEDVVFNKNDRTFKPMSQKQIQDSPTDIDVILERVWEPQVIGHRLAYVYRKLGIIYSDWNYIQQAIKMYQKCLILDPHDKSAPSNIKELKDNMHNTVWLKKQQDEEALLRNRFGMSVLDFAHPEKVRHELTQFEVTDKPIKANLESPGAAINQGKDMFKSTKP